LSTGKSGSGSSSGSGKNKAPGRGFKGRNDGILEWWNDGKNKASGSRQKPRLY
jgi:hypothetical protein